MNIKFEIILFIKKKFVYGVDCSRFPAGEKGVRRPGPVEDGEKMLLC